LLILFRFTAILCSLHIDIPLQNNDDIITRLMIIPISIYALSHAFSLIIACTKK
jgi:hypothetical protein